MLPRRQSRFPRIRSQSGENDTEDQGGWHPFSIPAESIPGCMFSANFVSPCQICEELSCGRAEFPTVLGQNGQNDDPHFQYQPRVSHDACLVQIWWFQLKSVMRYRATTVTFTDKQTYGGTVGQTDRRRQRQYPFGMNTRSKFAKPAAGGSSESSDCDVLMELL